MAKLTSDEQDKLDEINVRRFMRDLIVNDAHKKALKKAKLVEWARSYWCLTDKGRDIANKLGLE